MYVGGMRGKRQGTKIKRGRPRSWSFIRSSIKRFKPNSAVKLLGQYSLLNAHMGLKAIQYSGKVSNIQQEKVYMVLVIEFLARASPSTERVWRFCCVGRLTFSQVAFFLLFFNSDSPAKVTPAVSFLCQPSLYFFSFSAALQLQTQIIFPFPLCLIWQPVLKLHNE